MVELPGLGFERPVAGQIHELPVLAQLLQHDGLVAFEANLELHSRRRCKRSCGQVAVQIAVVVDVGKGHRHAGAVEIQAEAARAFAELHFAVGSPFVDVQPIRLTIAAGVDVQIAVVVDIDERGAGAPKRWVVQAGSRR